MNLPPPPPQQPPVPRHPFSMGRILLGVVCVGLGLDIALRAVQRHAASPSEKIARDRIAPAQIWSRRAIGELSLEAPFEFGPGPDIYAKLPREVREAMESCAILDSGEASNPRVMISRMTYKAEVRLSLDGALQGAMTNGAAVVGDKDPDYTSVEIAVGPWPARRASYENKTGATHLFLESVVAQNGQTLWQVQAIFAEARYRGEAERMLKSLRVEEPH